MGTYYTDAQIRDTIKALEDYYPGIWEIMKRMSLVADPRADAYEADSIAIVRALTVVLPQMSFVAEAENKLDAENRLRIDVGNAFRAEADAAKNGD